MNDLVISEGFNLKDLSAEMGTAADTGGSGGRMKSLRVNRAVEDKDGRELPRGHFFLTGEDETAYAASVTFRPLSHHFQYMQYDAATKKYVCWSRQISSFQEEARDIRGTLRCGRPDSKALAQLSREEKQKYKDIKNIRLVRGVVSFVGKTLDGKEVVYENVPCLLRLTGQNNFQSSDKGVYAPFDAQVRDRVPRGYELWNFDLTLTSKKNRSDDGETIWYTIEYNLDPKDPKPVTQEVYDSIVHIAGMIRNENATVDKQYAAALMGDRDYDDAIEALGASLDDDLEDAA